MSKVEVVKCKKCSNNVGTLTDSGILGTVLEDSTSTQKVRTSRPSDAWFNNSYIPLNNIVALCTSCMNVDTIIEVYMEMHSTGHSQNTLLRLVVVSNIIASNHNMYNEDTLDIVTLDNGSIVFDYSKYNCYRTVRHRTSSKGNSKP